MIEKEIIVSNKLGLHARASAKLVQSLQGSKSDVWLICNGREINAKSIMGVMMLSAGLGAAVTVRANGDDQEDVIARVLDLFERKFDEGA